jgi:hypothetical protein
MGDWLDGIGRCLSPISPFAGLGKGISLRCWTRWRRRGTSARLAALVLGIHMALQQVDLYFLIPHIVGRQVRLHPMVVIIGIIGGGMLAGVLGILLTAPAIASGVALARYVYC